jgi:hypothetical protein
MGAGQLPVPDNEMIAGIFLVKVTIVEGGKQPATDGVMWMSPAFFYHGPAWGPLVADSRRIWLPRLGMLIN